MYDYKEFLGESLNPKSVSNISILILNAPCNGFGDIIFAYKLYLFIKKNYNCKVYIATPDVKLIKLLADFKKQTIIKITDKKGNHPGQCRRFSKLKIHSDKIFDIVFVAPIAWDFTYKLNDIKKIIPYANKFNTFSFSEYNDYLDKDITFNTGVGGK